MASCRTKSDCSGSSANVALLGNEDGISALEPTSTIVLASASRSASVANDTL